MRHFLNLFKIAGITRFSKTFQEERPADADTLGDKLLLETCPEMIEYTVRGRSVITHRVRTEDRVSLASDPYDPSSDSAFSEIISYEKCFYPATEAQLNYLSDLRVDFPPGISLDDASCLISRAIGEIEVDDIIPVQKELAEAAAQKGVLLSKYCVDGMALTKIWPKMNNSEKVEFFIFCLYQNIVGNKDYKLEESKALPLIEEFREKYENDETFLRYITVYYGSELSVFKPFVNRNRGAYKVAYSFLKERGAV